jgi:hypothetical protein
MQVKQDNGSLASPAWWSKPPVKVGVVATVAVFAIVIAWILSPCPSPVEHAPHVVVVEPSDVLELPTDLDPWLVLNGAEERLAPGDFVTAEPDWEADPPHAPEGFLLEVKRSTIADGVTTVEVEPASLFEAEPEEELSTEALHFHPVELSSVEESAPSPVEVPAGEPVFSRASLATASEAPTPVGEVEESLKKAFGCGSSAKIEVGGEVETSLEPNVKLAWSRRGRFSVGIDYAAAWVKGVATARLTARAEGDLRCEPDSIVLVEPSWRTVVVVGNVPVPVTVSLPVVLSASARANADVSAGAEVESNAILGVSYSEGAKPKLEKGFVPPRLVSKEFDPELTLSGSAEASVFPAVSVTAGWKAPGLGKLAAVATLGVRGGVHFGYAAGERPPARACVPVVVEASLAVHLLRKRLSPWTVTPYKANLICHPRDPKSEGKGEAG